MTKQCSIPWGTSIVPWYCFSSDHERRTILCGLRRWIGATDTDLGVSQTLRRKREDKRKCRSRPIVRCGPETSLMSLNNRAADGESDSQTGRFGSGECFEDSVRGVRRQTEARIFHTLPDLIALNPFGSDEQLSRAIVNSVHRVRSISKQVQDV